MAVKLAGTIRFEDDWYAVQELDSRTFAIGEPLYHQQNWSYLLVGDERTLLFDTGSFCRNISGVVSRLTDTSPIVLPSHMHYDHLGNIHRFRDIAVADLPMLRQCVASDVLTPTEPLFLGKSENNIAPSFEVKRWITIGSEIDLGGRSVQILHTPGHSPDSISLFAAGENRLFSADFIYPGCLYAQVPGASLPDYLDVAENLTRLVSASTDIYCAHGDIAPGGIHSAPHLHHSDLRVLARELEAIRVKMAGGTLPDLAPVPVHLSDRLSMTIGPDAIEDWKQKS